MKVVSKYFNPETYRATGKMSYRVGSNLVENLPNTDETYVSSKIAIRKREINFWSSKLIDFSGF